jgi:16S rRNA G966 N2-methylase RsmD
MKISSAKLAMNLQIKINKEYAGLVPEMSASDYEALKLDIKERGLLVRITVNGQGVIIDGHHRYRACQELGIKCSYVVKEFENELLEKLFVIDSNLKRRHLNSFQRAELALKEKPILEEIAKRQMLTGKSLDLNQSRVDTNKEIGKRIGLSKDTIRKVEKIQKKAPPKFLDKARSGIWSINSTYNKIINSEIRDKLINAKPAIELPADSVQLIQGDFRSSAGEIPDNSIDLILTDPPYTWASLPLYRDLGILAARVLKDGGSLVTIVGHYALVKCANYIEESGLVYIHDIPIIHSGGHELIFKHRISVRHKPMLWFLKGEKLSPHNIIDDVIYSTPPKKELHEWEQSPAEAEHIISGLTVGENQIILDPFMGAGTFGRASLKLNRKFIGIEIDPQRFEIAKANLAKDLVQSRLSLDLIQQ